MERSTEKKHILVLEDDSSISEILAWILTDAGYRVTSVTTVRDARRECEEALPDVVIADLLLPDGMGSELVEELGTRWGKSSPPTILMSAVPQVHRKAEASGASICLTKPFNLSELMDAVAHLNNSGSPELQPY